MPSNLSQAELSEFLNHMRPLAFLLSPLGRLTTNSYVTSLLWARTTIPIDLLYKRPIFGQRVTISYHEKLRLPSVAVFWLDFVIKSVRHRLLMMWGGDVCLEYNIGLVFFYNNVFYMLHKNFRFIMTFVCF